MFVRKVFKAVLRSRAEAINAELTRLGDNERLGELPRGRYVSAVGGGRRFRPLLTLIASEGVGGDWRDALGLAASVELLHKASLLHDDLVDEDRRRRGATTFWVEHGAHEAVIMGDLLVALSFSTAAKWEAQCGLPPGTTRSVLEDTLRDLALGEMLDLHFESRDDVAKDAVVRMLHLKSGSLIGASLELGAVAGGAHDAVRGQLRELGGLLGVAFQMINDLNNVNGMDGPSKGSIGQDLARGKKTLPTLALRSAGVGVGDIAGLPRGELERLVAPAQAALDDVRAQAMDVCDALPKGQMRLLFGKLLEHAQDAWFWVEQDA